MDNVWMAIAGFIGAILGSVITGYLVELYRQENRLQIAALDKRLEAYQEGFRQAVELGAQIMASRLPEEPHPEEKSVQELQHEGFEWLLNNNIYLGEEVGYKLLRAFRNTDVGHVRGALIAIEQAAGLPRLNDDWWPFSLDENR